ncbi:MAG: hypothetical protein PF501_15705 [Salinisphaera sp.]|jgi:hypothetical protein|nr:hypothetical protein [Salinisphaera sp.]
MAALVVMAAVLAPPPAGAAGSDYITPFSSSDLRRQIQGRQRELDLSAAGRKLGDARVFAGLDALSTARQKYLTSGLQWESAKGPTPALQLSALHTESTEANFGSQTLIRAESRLNLGQRWYMPVLTTEIAQVSQGGSAALGGRAAHIGFSHAVGRGRLNIGYFATDSAFHALGSDLAAGDRGFELSGQQALIGRWQLSNTLRLHRSANATATWDGIVQRWTLAQRPELTDIGQPWRLSAQIGSATVVNGAGHTPLSLELAVETMRWRDWRVNSTVGWFGAGMATPNALPVSGGMWQMAASHVLDIAGLQARISPTFAVGGSPYRGAGLGSRTGLGIALPGLGSGLNFNVDYLSAGWSSTSRHDDVRVTLNYSHAAGGLMPDLSSLGEHLRAPWSHRY